MNDTLSPSTIILPEYANVLAAHQRNEPGSKFPLYPFFHQDLRRVSSPFVFDEDHEDREVIPLVEQFMIDQLCAYKTAGVSGPQLGIFKQVIAIGGTEEFTRVMFNPVITSVSEHRVAFEERCITAPEFSLTLSRPMGLVIQYQTADGTNTVEQYQGITARLIFHEYDYLHGINFTDHASNFKLQWELKKYKKKLKKRLRNTPVVPLTT